MCMKVVGGKMGAILLRYICVVLTLIKAEGGSCFWSSYSFLRGSLAHVRLPTGLIGPPLSKDILYTPTIFEFDFYFVFS